jgi:hypothetical protein
MYMSVVPGLFLRLAGRALRQAARRRGAAAAAVSLFQAIFVKM